MSKRESSFSQISIWALLLCGGVCVLCCEAQGAVPRSKDYEALQQRLARGWNTWDTHSVMTEVLLPEGLAVRVGIKDQGTEGSDGFLPAALIGRQGKEDERVVPGPHAYDGSYTDLKLTWRGREVRVQSAHEGDDLVMLVTPLHSSRERHVPAAVVFSIGMLWNRPGAVVKRSSGIEATFEGKSLEFYLAAKESGDLNVPVSGAYLAAELTESVGLSSGKARSVAEIQRVLDRQRAAYVKSTAGFGERAAVADAIQTVIGWDTIYEPVGKRVISPVSRIWSVGWGGYVLFDWDTYFAATLAAVGDRDLAYANAIEIGREATGAGFIPNYARSGNSASGGWKSSDRSEPPVGAITVLGLYEKFHDRWLVEETFPALLTWNRWWHEHRDREGYLVWGSDGQNEPRNLDDGTGGTLAGAILESGLDNSPMYDGASFDAATHQMLVADVGLMGMYVADCEALATMAGVLGKPAEASELKARAEGYRAKLGGLWDEKRGIFLNKDLRTGASGTRLSPTNFYALLGGAATGQQAERMVREHLKNSEEFWGEWVLPSIARNDAAFKDQDYWRGRIWGPMNYLVYLGLKKYAEPEVVEARKELAAKSLELFLKDWRASGHVHENYNGATGDGDDVSNSDRFYHWGALLGLMELEERTMDGRTRD